MKHLYTRTLFAVLTTLAFAQANAQVLVVNDNDNITYNTDTLLNDLAAAGISYDVYDIPTTGTPPPGTLLDTYDQVIWYCSTDGVNLGFWDAATQTNLTDRILAGRKTWIIGQDILFALYGAAPVPFAVGEFPRDFMGIASYDVQSYGDDGNTGCPGMVVDGGVAGNFSAGFTWSFPTAWWVDGVTPTADATPIYLMGPAPYALDGAISMVHFHAEGTNVMSTLFDPVLIGTFEGRITFLQETLTYMDVIAGVLERAPSVALRLAQNPTTDRVDLLHTEAIREVTLTDMRGMVVLKVVPAGTVQRTTLHVGALASGPYVATVTGLTGTRSSVVLVKE